MLRALSTLDSNANDRYWDVHLDKRLLERCRATGEGVPWTMSVSSLETWARLKLVPCADFGPFERIWIDVADGKDALGQFIDCEGLDLAATATEGLTRIDVQFRIRAGDWTHPWSINTLAAAIRDAIKSVPGYEWRPSWRAGSEGFNFTLSVTSPGPNAPVGDVAGTALTLLRELVALVSERLKAEIASHPTRSGVSLQPTPSIPSKPDDRVGSGLLRPRGLTVFLCHASEDKAAARELRKKLLSDGFDPWLDENELLPGQDWTVFISQAVRQADVVVVCLSSGSVDKTGFVQREIRIALDAADERPEGSPFLIPARIETCRVPERLSHWQRVDLFAEGGYALLCRSLDSARLHGKTA